MRQKSQPLSDGANKLIWIYIHLHKTLVPSRHFLNYIVFFALITIYLPYRISLPNKKKCKTFLKFRLKVMSTLQPNAVSQHHATLIGSLRPQPTPLPHLPASSILGIPAFDAAALFLSAPGLRGFFCLLTTSHSSDILAHYFPHSHL